MFVGASPSVQRTGDRRAVCLCAADRDAIDTARPVELAWPALGSRAADRNHRSLAGLTADLALPLRAAVADRAAGECADAARRAICDVIRVGSDGGGHGLATAGAAAGAAGLAVPPVAAGRLALAGTDAGGVHDSAALRGRLGLGLLRAARPRLALGAAAASSSGAGVDWRGTGGVTVLARSTPAEMKMRLGYWCGWTIAREVYSDEPNS